MSYGQVAAYVGSPRAARQVGWTMRSMEGAPNFPWWRVINNAGVITIKGNRFNSKPIQKQHLEAEGVSVTRDFKVDIKKYRFYPDTSLLKSFQLEPEYIEQVLLQYSSK